MFSGIRGRLFVGFLAVFLLAVAGTATYSYMGMRRVMDREVQSRVEDTAQSIQTVVRLAADLSVTSYLRAVSEKALDIVSTYGALARTGRMSEEEAKAQAARMLLALRVGTSGYVYVIGSTGVMQVHPQVPLVGQNLSNYTFVQEQLRRQSGYIQYEWRNPGESRRRPKALYMVRYEPWDWIISASAYRDEFRDLVDINAFKDTVLSFRIGETGYAYMLTGGGELLIHPWRDEHTGQDWRDGSGRRFVQEMLERREGRIRYTWKNPGDGSFREKVAAFTYMPEYDWIVVASGYMDELQAPVLELRNVTMVAVTGGGVMLALLGWWCVAAALGPLRRLAHAVRRGAEGDLAVRFVPEGQDEVGRLADDFNRLMGNLEAHTSRLEDKVQERTLELTRLNAAYREEIDMRREVEGKARHRLEFLRSLMNAVPCPIFFRNKEGAFIDCNDNFAELVLGVDIAEVAGKRPEDFPGVYLPIYLEEMRRGEELLWRDGGVQSMDVRIVCGDGLERRFRVSKRPFVSSEGEEGLLGVMVELPPCDAEERA